MGNIYYDQKKFPQAIKMYRMALDQIPSTGKSSMMDVKNECVYLYFYECIGMNMNIYTDMYIYIYVDILQVYISIYKYIYIYIYIYVDIRDNY
jgi:hypothetical protein